MELLIESGGQVRYVYEELVDLTSLGQVVVTRASHVEPDETARWYADLSPLNGPRLGPFASRSRALAAEIAWLQRHWLVRPR